MNWKAFWQGLAAAAVTGAAGGATAVMSTNTGETTNWKAVGNVSAVAAIAGALAFLLKSPLQQGPMPPAPPSAPGQ